MCERVNRYTVIFLHILLTSSLSYGKMRLGKKIVFWGAARRRSAAPMGRRSGKVAAAGAGRELRRISMLVWARVNSN